MRVRRIRPKKPPHNQIINAIYDTVISACGLRRPGGNFSVKVADLPESAKGYSEYDLERVALRLNIRNISVRTMTMNSDTFYFYKP